MNIGRPIEFDRAVALEQAQQLFWRKGYCGTSLADLLAGMGLSKSSFYQAFKSKHDIFQQSIQRYLNERTTMMRQRLKANPTAYAFIKEMLYSVASNSGIKEYRKGCLVMNTACEFGQSDEVVAKAVRDSVEAFIAVFEEAVILGQQQGDIAADKNPRTVASFLVNNISGLNIAYKAGADSRSLRAAADITLSALK